MATYTNKVTGETYKIAGVHSIQQAWNLAYFVCAQNNWNIEMFCDDVTVKYESK